MRRVVSTGADHNQVLCLFGEGPQEVEGRGWGGGEELTDGRMRPRAGGRMAGVLF